MFANATSLPDRILFFEDLKISRGRPGEDNR